MLKLNKAPSFSTPDSHASYLRSFYQPFSGYLDDLQGKVRLLQQIEHSFAQVLNGQVFVLNPQLLGHRLDQVLGRRQFVPFNLAQGRLVVI
jgi:hypothetical protein